MTKIKRMNIESTLVTGLLTIFRKYLSDPLNPQRTNTLWIRSSVMSSETPTVNHGRKSYIVKESNKPSFPQVIIGNYQEINTKQYINNHWVTAGEIIIRILDVGDVTRIGGLGGQISYIIKNYSSVFSDIGIKKITMTATPTGSGADEINSFFEKEITLSFEVIVDE